MTYHMDPHEYAANKKPLSLKDRAVGEFNPTVSIFKGCYPDFLSIIFLSTLNRPSVVVKKNICGSFGSNSISMLYVKSNISSLLMTFS